MDYLKKSKFNKLIIFIPAVFAFTLALIPTIKYNWPLSWDIYYHIHNMKLYSEGIVFWDNLTAAPYGRPIFYPPLFHLSLLSIVKILNISPFLAARLIQPFLALFGVFSFSYVSRKLYGNTIGFLTGMFIILSPLFQRMMLPIPEAMAIIFLPILAYFYYLSIEKGDKRYALVAGFIWGLILLTHLLSAIIILSVITLTTIILKIKGEKNLKEYWIIIIVGLITSSLWFIPILMKYGFVFKSPPTQKLPFGDYIKFIGPIPFFLALIGLINIIGDWEKKDMMIFSWFISVTFISVIYIFGVNVITERIIYFNLFPVAVLASLATKALNFEKRKYALFLLIIVVLSLYNGYVTANSTKPSISATAIEVAEWFKYHGDHERVVVAADYHLEPIIVSISDQPVAGGGYAPGTVKSINRNKYINGKFTKEEMIREKIGYIILKTNMTPPPYSRLVYMNNDFKIYERSIT
ncbi:MAG: glycosyltransferase family 39 protein [Methanothermobacter sp.]|nr:glycosyltransferase family 39 protein [Methanothermobacter sp.]